MQNPSTGEVVLFSPDSGGRPPVGIRAAIVENGLFAELPSGTSLRVEGIDIENTAGAGVRVNNGEAVHLKSVHVRQTQADGVFIYQSKNATIESSRVSSADSNCLKVTQVENVTITGNTLHACGALGTQALYGVEFSGVRLGTNRSVTVTNNDIARVGFGAIQLGAVAERANVTGNLVKGYCQKLNDCGALCINPGRDPANAGIGDVLLGENMILEGLGHIEGTPEAATGEHSAKGIYLDWRRSNTRVVNNTIITARSRNGGIFIHGGANNLVEGNTIIQSRWTSLAAAVLTNEPTRIRGMPGNLVRNNTFYTESETQGVVRLTDSALRLYCARPEGMLSLQGNRLMNPLAANVLAHDSRNVAGPEVLVSCSGSQCASNSLSWYAADGAGQHFRAFTNETLTSRAFPLDASYCNSAGDVVSGSLSVPARKAAVLLRCFCNSDGVCNNRETRATCSADCR